MDLQIDTNSKNHINAIVNMGKEDDWRLTQFYGEPITHKIFESWNLLRQLNNHGIYYGNSIIILIFHGCVWGTLMNY